MCQLQNQQSRREFVTQTIYLLRDRNRRPIYVGRTSNLKSRLSLHRRARNGRGIRFSSCVILEVTSQSPLKAERAWIAYFTERGFKLKNKREIASGPVSEEHRKKLSRSHLGKNQGAVAKWKKPGEKSRASMLAKKQMRGSHFLAEWCASKSPQERHRISLKAWRTKRAKR